MSGPWKLPGYTEVREPGSGASGRVVLAERGSARAAIKYLSGELLSSLAGPQVRPRVADSSEGSSGARQVR